jgi:hypothetical protein
MANVHGVAGSWGNILAYYFDVLVGGLLLDHVVTISRIQEVSHMGRLDLRMPPKPLVYATIYLMREGLW